MLPPEDDIDRIMHVMECAFPPDYGEGWNRRQLTDSLLLAGTYYGLIFASGSPCPETETDVAGFFLSRGLFDEEELLLFAIAPNFRRRGLGHRLLASFIEQARERGVRRLFLEMRKNNPAAFLYASHGFQPIGIRPRYYRTPGGERIDAISQELVLT